jgi:hypothetical protein
MRLPPGGTIVAKARMPSRKTSSRASKRKASRTARRPSRKKAASKSRKPSAKAKAVKRGAKRKTATRKRQTQPNLVDRIAGAAQIVADSFEEAQAMQRKAGSRGGLSDG